MPVSAGNANGSGSIVIGIVFLLAGLYIAGIGFQVWEVDSRRIHAPLIFIKLFGFIFAAAGVYICSMGMKDVAFRRRMSGPRKSAPLQPWLWDHDWSSRGTESRVKLNHWGSHIVGLSVTGTFLYFTYWLGFEHSDGVRFPFYGMCFFAFLVGLTMAKQIRQRARYGEGFLEFSHFPFRLGETLYVTVRGLPPSADLESIEATLQFCREEYSSRRAGSSERTAVLVHVVYEDTQQISPQAIQPGGRLNLQFAIPQDPDWTSRVSARPAHFWELCVKGRKAGFDYAERFLVPIY